MTNLDNQLEVECISALAGASEVKNRVLSGLALGYPSVEDSAYLIKCRVKEHASLVKKVVNRRRDGKPDYYPSDATDIIGLRLLTLFRKDIPTLVSRFLSFVTAGQREDFSLFVGDDFKTACTEIIIYTTAPDGDEVDSLLFDIFSKRGLKIGIVDSDTENPDQFDVKVSRKKSQYSSIHLILWCQNGISKQDKHRIPMEVQIRTSLEDVWGEIDHTLRYKNETSEFGGDNDENTHITSAKEHLVILKKQLDICGESADTIAKQIDFASPIAVSSTILTSAYSVNMGKLVELPVNPKTRKIIESAVDNLTEAFGTSARGDYTSSQDTIIELVNLFSKSAAILESAADNIVSDGSLKDDERNLSLYYVLMEAALCHYWAGRIVNTTDVTIEGDRSSAESSDRLFRRSIVIYNRLAAEPEHSHDAILSYRIANVLTAQNQKEMAFEKFRDAVEDLKKYKQPHLSDDHFFRVRIPRQYGVALWETAERFKKKSASMGSDDFLIERRRRLYLQALEVTLPLLELKVNGENGTPELDFEDGSHERVKTANNVVEYASCFLRSGGDIEALEVSGISLDSIREFIQELEGDGGIEGVEVPVWADTLRAAYQELFDDPNSARKAAAKVIELIENNPDKWNVRYGRRFASEMLDDAKKTLDSLH